VKADAAGVVAQDNVEGVDRVPGANGQADLLGRGHTIHPEALGKAYKVG
jgi:hypothetical protein